jgi:hypothetical protein
MQAKLSTNSLALNEFATCMGWTGIDTYRKWMAGRPLAVESVAKAAKCLGVAPQELDPAGEAYRHAAPKGRRTKQVDPIVGLDHASASTTVEGEAMGLTESLDRIVEGLPLRLRQKAREAVRTAIAAVMTGTSRSGVARKKARA